MDEVPWYLDRAGAGRVDYEYRITRTEVTVGQWWEFAQIYQQYVAPDDNVTFGALSRDWLLPAPNRRYTLDPGTVNFPVTSSWYLAARYCNWLKMDGGPIRQVSRPVSTTRQPLLRTSTALATIS